MNFGANVKKVREKVNLTQVELAHAASVTPAMINQIEKGMMRTKSGGEISVNYAGFFLKRVTFVLTRSDVSGRALLVRTACL